MRLKRVEASRGCGDLGVEGFRGFRDLFFFLRDLEGFRDLGVLGI